MTLSIGLNRKIKFVTRGCEDRMFNFGDKVFRSCGFISFEPNESCSDNIALDVSVCPCLSCFSMCIRSETANWDTLSLTVGHTSPKF